MYNFACGLSNSFFGFIQENVIKYILQLLLIRELGVSSVSIHSVSLFVWKSSLYFVIVNGSHVQVCLLLVKFFFWVHTGGCN